MVITCSSGTSEASRTACRETRDKTSNRKHIFKYGRFNQVYHRMLHPFSHCMRQCQRRTITVLSDLHDVRTNVPGTCRRGLDGVEHCSYCYEHADIPGVEHSSWKGCRTDRTNKHSPLQFPASSCRSKGFPVCCHSPSVNKGELRLAAWYKPNTRCSSIHKVPCPYGGDLVQNAKLTDIICDLLIYQLRSIGVNIRL